MRDRVSWGIVGFVFGVALATFLWAKGIDLYLEGQLGT